MNAAVTHRANVVRHAIRGACLVVAAVPLVGMTATASAHEIRPGFLNLRETAPSEFTLEWRVPTLHGNPLPIHVEAPAGASVIEKSGAASLPGTFAERISFKLSSGITSGQRLRFPGLEQISTDVLVHATFLDGRSYTAFVYPSNAWFEIDGTQTRLEAATTLVLEGVRHILFGVDHLLFVFGLVLIVKDRWMLVKTVTAFTVAHSITLAIATLGFARLPEPPLNCLIALSILFLGPEIVRIHRGQSSFTIRHPWVVAFLFGLIHGFGFASAMTSAGLSPSDLPLALLCFNVGVEIGQLGFVALVLLLMRSFRQLEIDWPRSTELLPAYTVGTLGAFWTIYRTANLFGWI